MKRIVDLSHAIGDGTVTYPGLPAPSISDFLTREESKARYTNGTTFHIARIDMVANTGTYLDAPSHRYEGAEDISQIPLSRVADLEGVVIDATRAGRALDASLFAPEQLRGRAVLVRTDWSRHFGTDEYTSGRHPFLTESGARALVAANPALVGIDSTNIDDIDDGTRPAHSLLLKAGIALVEHLANLDQLPDSAFRFFAVPAKFAGMGTFPVRAFAIVR